METVTDAEIELAQLRGSLEEWRCYLAGPCTIDCISHGQIDSLDELYNGHKHWTEWYEGNRSSVVALNHLLTGEFDYATALRQMGER